MATYRFPRMLTLLAWEAELRHGTYADERAWSHANPAEPLKLDFSRVEFADFGALARALLLLDAAARSGIPATVTLPVATAFATGDQSGMDSTLAARQARARGDALAFMRQVGFLDALRAPHWRENAVDLLDWAATDSWEPVSWSAPSDLDPQDAPYRRRRVFPFRWLEPMPAAQLRESESFLAVSAGLEDIGLSQSDARTLSQTVLTELVENVAKHGAVGDRKAVALVGAILVGAETYELRQNGMHPHMTEVAERALADGSQMLRVIVADSGADLTDRLVRQREQPGIGRVTVSDRRRQETILNALGNRSAMSGEDKDGRRGTTGLWWVARVVRSYHGGVQARTADLLAGVLFGREAGGTDVAEAGFGHVPGTLLELTLPVGPSPPRSRTPWGSQSALGTAPRLCWLNCAFDSRRGLADADRLRLADQVRSIQADHRADGLIVTVPLHEAGHTEIDDGWRGAMYQLLEFASSIARSCTVVVAFPDAEPHMLDPCVALFNEGLAVASGEDTHDPILVLGRQGDPVWCGGSVPLRALLNMLSEGAGAADLGEARCRWQRAGGESARFSETLRVNGHLLSVGLSRLQLRLSLPVVHGTIERAVSRSLVEAIERGGEGVERGIFRGPTLRVTNRWIYVEPLLDGTIGLQLAAFVLARKVEAALRASARAEAPTAIFQVKSAPRPLARHLSECLSLTGRYYPQPSELNSGEPPIGEQVPVGAKVVLCADTIRSEDTVRRAVAIVAGWDADPLVIACVVDARDNHGPVRLLNRTIPVVSLTEVRISFNGPGDEIVTDIDPLLLRPELPAVAEPARAQQADLLTWFAAEPDVLRLGHIDDPARRHYSAFIRLQAMRQRKRRDQITEAVLSNVRGAFAEIRARGDRHLGTEIPIAIWYVTSDGNAGTLAEIVHDYLVAEGFQVSAVTAVPRWTAGDTWAFPTSLTGVSRPVGVLIVHWWAITGSTVLQMVRLAGKSGASWIAAVCLLNQLDANDADALRMLRAVSVPTMAADGLPSGGNSAFAANIPVAIRFVAGSGIIAFDAHGCPICATRERYRLDEGAATPRLLGHANLLREMLRPRELEEVARDSAADLFTVPVTGSEAIDYLRWRRLLRRALRKVSGRQEVIDRLRALTGPTPPELEWTSVGLIRLLAAEQQWLRLPPLHFEIAAELLSRVCLSCLEQVTTPPWLRVQALMVMSAAIPHRLVELMPRLLELAGNETVLVDQMLLDCCRLLLRSPGDSPIDVVRLRRNLIICRDYLEEQRAESDAMATEDHLHAVRNLLTVADYRILDKPKDAQAAWERLREDLVRPVVRHRLEAELLLVRSFVEDLEGVEPSPDAVRAASADWDTCARQLEERALANLSPLRDIIAGDFVADWLGRKDQRRLLTLARPDVGELRAVSDRLHALAQGSWRPADPSWQAVRRELLDRINWWNRIFLAVHLNDQGMPALLVELIRSAPVKKLGRCVDDLLGVHQAQATIDKPERGDVEVFCPEKLLDQIITHLLENIEKHCVKGAVCRLQIEYMRPAHGNVQMVARNSGTAPSAPPGRGLKALNDKLRPFGGSLTGQVLADDEWTFAATATLPLWHGG
jgi:adenine/guanine phosphoribosyltransferase-like PRPP-binding protein